MLSRLIFGLALGLLMYMPRPRGPESGPPGTLPPGAEEPPGGMEPPITDDPYPVPEVPTDPPFRPGPGNRYPKAPMPSVPPTPPPGYEGDWPPASEREDIPPTPPPGYDGAWPDTRPTIRDRIIDILRDLGFFGNLRKDAMVMDAHAGAKAVGGALKATEDQAQAS